MAREKKHRSRGRRSPFAAAALIGAGLLLTGGVYAGASAAMASTTDAQTSVTTELTAADGQKLFTANCATCHGMDLQGTKEGPSLVGVGELAVEFQMSTGRMPLQMQGPQAPQKHPQFTEAQIRAVYSRIGTSIGYRTVRKDISGWFVGIGFVLLLGAAAANLAWQDRML